MQHTRPPCTSRYPSLLRLRSIESVMPSKHLTLCHTLLLQPSIFPSIRVSSMSQDSASGGQSNGVSASTSVLPMITAALFTIARTWKQPRCPLTDEWIKKLRYIYTMDYYSAIKRNECGSVELRWIPLEPVRENEASQKEKNNIS